MKNDKDFLSAIRKEIDNIDKELKRKDVDDLNLSSDSADSVKSSQELSSEFSISESLQEEKIKKGAKVRTSLPNIKNVLPISKSFSDKEKIKELERSEVFRRVKEMEERRVDEKKHTQRIQEINNSLIKKVRDLELDLKEKGKGKKGKIKSLKAENQRLGKEVQELREDLRDAQKIIEVINRSYDVLVEGCKNFEQKSRSLVEINEKLKSHLVSLLPPKLI